MSVEIEPLELSFQRPFTVEVSQSLRLTNQNKEPIAFKVKTTAPKQYCVRPNSGRIEPGHHVEVSVLLQAMKQEPPFDTRCRDKFLLQSVIISGDKEFNTSISQIWDSVDKSAIQERKIRVNWLAAGSEGRQEDPITRNLTPVRQSLANGNESTPDGPPAAYSSPSENHSPDPGMEVKREPEPEAEPVPATTTGRVLAAVQSTSEATVEELKRQLASAEETITSLKNDVAGGLRQRRAGDTSATEQKVVAKEQDLAQVARQSTEGVPIQVVAVLCLISFLLAYFFF